MKYRLKDRDLQRKLDDITAGGFSKVLEKKIDVTFFCEEFLFLGAGSIRVRLFESAFEEVPEYDPNKWNLWPDVEPPQDVPLRIEVREPDKDLHTPEPRFGKIRKKACACFDGSDWCFWPGKPFGAYIDIEKGEVVRFRPWVGPDEEAVG